eukprot:GHVU01064419.1.p1 GENE.GHVU01064419.1~~GHVU01064419.1.p1  ORF type:complete len:172 (+),score=38.07 GHVU01064419.1:144-659(+)
MTTKEDVKDFVLTTPDGAEIMFSEDMLKYLKRIWDTVQVSEASDEPLRLQNVDKRSLELIRKYTESRVAYAATEKAWLVPTSVVDNKNFRDNAEVQDADKDLLQDLDKDQVVTLLKAAGECDMEDLKKVCSVWIAHHLYGKDTYQIRTEWQLVNDYTPEEEAEFEPVDKAA